MGKTLVTVGSHIVKFVKQVEQFQKDNPHVIFYVEDKYKDFYSNIPDEVKFPEIKEEGLQENEKFVF